MQSSGNAVVRACQAAKEQGNVKMIQEGGSTVAREGGHQSMLLKTFVLLAFEGCGFATE